MTSIRHSGEGRNPVWTLAFAGVTVGGYDG